MNIRRAGTGDTDTVISIWLEASVRAHGFIDARYWRGKAGDMRDVYLPRAETFIAVDDGNNIVGFISMVGNCIAALFISPANQGRGLGGLLIDHIKTIMSGPLTLTVYKENLPAVKFYEKHGFMVTEERNDDSTGHPEYVMLCPER